MTAQRLNASSRTTQVAQEQLDDRACTDDLYTLGLLCPANRITESRSAFASRVLDERLRDQLKLLLCHPAHLLYHLRCVACEVAAHNLEHTVWMLKGGIGERMPLLVILVLPTALIGICACLWIIAREETI